MSLHENVKEWPLVVFTMATQLACGLALAATLLDSRAPSSEVESMRPLAIAIFPLVAVGALFSLLHLGRPFAAWKSFLNLGRSRLSLEILLTTLFAVAALVYSAFWLTGRTDLRLAWGMGTSVLGLATVVSGAAIYMVRTQPVWNSGWLPVSFLGTTLLMGGLTPLTLFALTRHNAVLRTLLEATIAGSLLLLLAAFWMLRRFCHLSRGKLASARHRGVAPLLSLWSCVPFGLYVLLAGILPAALAFRLWMAAHAPVDISAIRLTLPAFVSMVLGAVLGRMLMYLAGTALSGF